MTTRSRLMESLAKQGLTTSPSPAPQQTQQRTQRSRPASRRTASAVQEALDFGETDDRGQNRNTLGYQVKCQACSYSRYCGGELDMRTKAEGHARKKGLGHKVDIFHDGSYQETVRNDIRPTDYSGPPPF